jgi:hypothetical protein
MNDISLKLNLGLEGKYETWLANITQKNNFVLYSYKEVYNLTFQQNVYIRIVLLMYAMFSLHFYTYFHFLIATITKVN